MADVRMPDGTIIRNVPEGTTKQELMRRLELARMPQLRSTDATREEIRQGARQEVAEQAQAIQDEAPLFQRAIAGNTEATKDVATIGAATVGSLAAPQLAIPAFLSRLGLAGKAVAPFVQNAPSIAGAAIGGGAGASAATLGGGGTAGEAAAAGLEGAKDMAAAEAIGIGTVAALQKAAAPVAGRLTKGAKELLEFSKREGVPISTSTLAPGMASRVLDGGSELFLPGRLTNRAWRSRTVQRLNELMGQLPKLAGNPQTREITADVTQQAFKEVVDTLESTGKRLSGDFLNAVGRKTEIPVTQTRAVLDDIITNSKNDQLINFARRELDALGDGTAKTAEGLETLLRQVGGELKKVRGAEKNRFVGPLREAIKGDFAATAGDAMELMNKSNQFFARNRALLDSPEARKLASGAFTPQNLTVRLFRSGNEDFLKALKKNLPAKVWDDLRAQNIQNMLETISEPSKLMGARAISTKGAEKGLKILDDHRSAFVTAYGDDTVQALENFLNLSKSAGKDVAKFEADMGIADFLSAGPAGAIVSSPSVVVGGGALNALIANEMIRPNGILKRWLTTGYKVGKTTEQGLKLGGRAVMSNGEDTR